MNSTKFFLKSALLTLFILHIAACGSSSGGGSSYSGSAPNAGGSNSSGGTCTATSFAESSYPSTGVFTSNVVSVTVNGSTCGGNSSQYPNEPCVQVTICSPSDPNNCQTINNILLDTGSYGLRIFSSVINVPLTPITSNGNNLAECVQYGDGSSQWGQVQYAYVQLAGEPKVALPIMTVNPNYATPPSACSTAQSTPDVSPSQTGFNGILGVGLFKEDCGNNCANQFSNGQYFSCNGSNCSCGAKVSLAAQVQNPVASIPTDNNGVIVSLPSVPAAGAASISGSMYLGIGTRANNAAGAVTTYAANVNGEFSTQFTNSSNSFIPSFIDSGSSILFIPPPSGLADCSSHGAGWGALFCPNATTAYSATNKSATGAPTGVVNFSIANGYSLFTSNNMVFGNVAGTNSGAGYFDWGIPFFYGRNVYVGISGMPSSVGTGPYWAY